MKIAHRVTAYWDLLARYCKVFTYFWGQRKSIRGGLFNENEAAFMSPALSLQERPVSPTARLTAMLLIALIVGLLVWSSIGHVDIIVNAPGKIIPSGRVKTIASVDIASVRALHVVEGQQVKAGDLLIELDTRASDAERDKAIGDNGDAILQVARSNALIAAIDSGSAPRLQSLETLRSQSLANISPEKWKAEQLHVESLYSDYLAKLRRLDGDIAHFSASLPLAAERAKDYQDLLTQHDVSHHAWLEKEQARMELEGQLASVRNQRTGVIAETRRTAYDQMTEGNRLAASSREDALRADSHSKLHNLIAPVDGTVQQLAVHTVGGVVPMAQPLLQIVPSDDTVEIEASLDNKDVGFVHEGQSAQIKIDTFSYTSYGTIAGKVTHVSRDAVVDEKGEKKTLQYTVKVTLDRSTIPVDGKLAALTPGMTVNVEVKTGDRRVIEYVLDPLIEHQSEALHER